MTAEAIAPNEIRPAGQSHYRWPLMRDNITVEDLDALRDFLAQDPLPVLTQAGQVAAFEREWSAWLGTRFSVFVNSGSSANLITLAALRWRHGPGEVIVPPLTWVSDIAAVLQNGFDPVFADIDLQTLGLDTHEVLRRITPRTRAVFLTHVLGYNALSDQLYAELQARGIPLLEDVCESHGATWRGRKLGTWGAVSNFSFYYAHHLSTIEGGMACTSDPEWYDALRMLRSHGLLRESPSQITRRRYESNYPDLNPDFIFAVPAYNVRSTELNAVLGRSQLRRLDECNRRRQQNLECFLKHLDPERYFTDFRLDGNCNYALTLLLRQPDDTLRDRVVQALRREGVEFRRGMSGGGNQLRQPYLRQRFPDIRPEDYPHAEHVHFYGFYIGNYPTLARDEILWLCDLLNSLPGK
jgi:CDP-6-deoxy-D-xylo-4-hexulose-3-dehydrase